MNPSPADLLLKTEHSSDESRGLAADLLKTYGWKLATA